MLMSQSLERELTVRERFALRLHLIVCPWCARYLRQIKLFGQVLNPHGCHTLEVPGSLSISARERIASAVKSAS